VPAVGHQPQERSNPRPWGGMTRVVSAEGIEPSTY
jgi:hypothetical protein